MKLLCFFLLIICYWWELLSDFSRHLPYYSVLNDLLSCWISALFWENMIPWLLLTLSFFSLETGLLYLRNNVLLFFIWGFLLNSGFIHGTCSKVFLLIFNCSSISSRNLPVWQEGRKLYLTNDGAIYLFDDILSEWLTWSATSVSMTTMWTSHWKTICQKLATVWGRGPWLAM